MMNLSFSSGRRSVTNAMADAAIRTSADVPESDHGAAPFERDELVSYSAHGIGRIDRIGTQDVGGHKLRVIEVRFPANQLTLRIPVASAHSSGLRRLVSRDLIDEALAVIVARPSIKRGNWTQRKRMLDEKLASGQVMQLAEVVRDLRHHAGNDNGSFSERSLFLAALERLAAELALLMTWDAAFAQAHLLELLKTAQETPASCG